MTREEFLAWVEQQPSGRFERIDGIVVAMAPERASNNLRKGSARDALRRAVREAGLTSCEVFGDGMTIQVGNSDFEPDAHLRCGLRPPGDSTTVSDPLVLVEVLSPDSGTRDRATKLRAYFKLPSVQHYLIVWPEAYRSPFANAKQRACCRDFGGRRNQPRSSGDRDDCRGVLCRLTGGSGRRSLYPSG